MELTKQKDDQAEESGARGQLPHKGGRPGGGGLVVAPLAPRKTHRERRRLRESHGGGVGRPCGSLSRYITPILSQLWAILNSPQMAMRHVKNVFGNPPRVKGLPYFTL